MNSISLRIIKNQSGQGLTEYITILVLVSLVAVGATASLGKTVKNKIKTANERIKTQVVLKEG